MNSDLWNDWRITAYVFGELADDDKAAFETELSQNQELASAVEEAKLLTNRLSEMYAAEVMPALDNARRQQITDCAANLPTVASPPAPSQHGSNRRWALNLAASLLLVGTGGSLWWLSQQSQDGMTVALQAPGSTASPAVSAKKQDSADAVMLESAPAVSESLPGNCLDPKLAAN